MQACLFRPTVGMASGQIQSDLESRGSFVLLFLPPPAILPSVIQNRVFPWLLGAISAKLNES